MSIECRSQTTTPSFDLNNDSTYGISQGFNPERYRSSVRTYVEGRGHCEYYPVPDDGKGIVERSAACTKKFDWEEVWGKIFNHYHSGPGRATLYDGSENSSGLDLSELVTR